MHKPANAGGASNGNHPPLQTLKINLRQSGSLLCQQSQCGLHTSSNGSGANYLPIDMVQVVVRQALPLGLQVVQVCAGDAFLHPGIDGLLAWLADLELSIVIETNGSGLTIERAERLARMPRISVLVGVCSDKVAKLGPLAENHGPLDLAVLAARLLSQAGITPQMVIPLQRSNAGQLKDMINLAEQAGAGSLRFFTPRPDCLSYGGSHHGGSNGKNGQQSARLEALSVEEQIALGWRIERKLAETTSLRLAFDEPPAFLGLRPRDPIAGQGRCSLQDSLAVLSSGEYALCGLAEQSRELVFGRVGSQPLERIWREHPLLLELRAGLPERLQGICDRCVMKSACRGNCPADTFLRSGSFFAPYWFCETAERAGLFPASRLIENNW